MFCIKEIQIKDTVRYHYTLTRTAKIKTNDNTKCLQGCKKTGSHTFHTLLVGV